MGAGSLSFWYNMYGSGTGTLTVDLYANGALAAAGVWSASGQQSANGSDWKKAVIDLDPYLPAQSLQLRFRADIGSSGLSDIAIDDLLISAASSSLPQSPDILADPAGGSVEQGQSVYLSVISRGFPAPQVQWYRNGNPIAGANGAAYFINAVDSSTTGVYEAVVSNSEGTLISYPAVVDIPGAGDPPPSVNDAYNGWASSALNSTNWSPDGDPDLDGVVNILEFAFNLDPSTASRSGMPEMRQVVENGQTYLELTFNRRIDHATADISYRVETSASMASGSWDSTPQAVAQVGAAVPNADGVTESVTYRRLAPLSQSQGFMRLDVEFGTVAQ